MFERWKYKRRTAEFFNPEATDEVSRNQLIQILRGEVVNPRKLEMISAGDYSYMVVGVGPQSPINSWAGQKWGPYHYEAAFAHADWYGRFSVEGDSHLVIPKAMKVFDFHYLLNGAGKCSSRDFSLLSTLPGLERDVSKHVGDKVLVSNLSVNEVNNCVREIFQR